MVRSESGGATATAGRREIKKAATRAALRDAVLSVVARQDVEAVTVEQLAAEADIAVRTLFNYVSSKEEALVSSLAAGVESLVAEFRARPRTESVLQALREAAMRVLPAREEFGLEHVGALRKIVHARTLLPQRMAVYAAQEEFIAAAIAERIQLASRRPDSGVRDEIYPRLCAAMMLTAFRVVLVEWLDSTPENEVPSLTVLAELNDAVITHLAAGLDRPGEDPIV